MIKIIFSERDEDIETWYKNKVNDVLANGQIGSTKKIEKEKNTKYKKNIKALELILKNHGISYSFEQIWILKYNELRAIKESIKDDSNFKIEIDKLKNGKKSKNNFLIDAYKKLRTKYGKELIEKTGVTVCPYCNRNFVNNGKNRAMAQFDHFFDKKTFPLFAISLYNLIPCCSSCNHTKQSESISFSPYDYDFRTDDMLTFNYCLETVNKYRIEINTNENIIDCNGKKRKNPIASNIEVLQLREQYNLHTDLLKQIIFKTRTMPESYLQEIREMLQTTIDLDLGMTEEEIYYDNYLSEEKYHLRPLSKFTHDIVANLKNDA